MKKLSEIEKDINSRAGKNSGDLKAFLLGMILLGLGVFLVFNQTSVQTSMYIWHIGSFGIPTGIVAVPLFIGIIMMFFNSKSFLSWIVLLTGLAFILVTIILSVQIRFRQTSLLTYVFMFGCILGGTGLLLKALYLKKND